MNVDSYLVRWISGSTENTESLSGETGSYVITGLETGSSYMVTVTASNSVGSSESDPEIAVTGNSMTWHLPYLLVHVDLLLHLSAIVSGTLSIIIQVASINLFSP